jgi:hypothetical protein
MAQNSEHSERSHSLSNFRLNEVSVVLPFRAVPNAFAPSSSITLSTDTPEWKEIQKHEFSKQFQWEALPTGNRNIRHNRTRYMGVLIVLLYNPL